MAGSLDQLKTPKGYASVSATSATAVALSSVSGGIPSGANVAIITPTEAIRWRDDGTAPTATVGYPCPADTELFYDGSVTKFQFIAQSTSATLDVCFYGV